MLQSPNMTGTATDSRRVFAPDEGLNPEQLAAATAGDGPILVLAGPGSGKTRVLTARVAHLIGTGVQPWQVLAVTFTNKAAREMRHRLGRRLGDEVLTKLTIGTFHGFCARLLRQEAEGAGIAPNYVIYDTADQRRVVRRALEDLEIDHTQHRPPGILAIISRAKNELLGPGDFVPTSYPEEIAARVFARYEELLGECNALDFDDLLLKVARLLGRDAAVRHRLQRRYAHVLVDEFQDTNMAQYKILKHLAAAAVATAPHNLFVVGDEDQSIYSWRGADWRNVDRFRTDFPGARTVLLQQNYRSTQNILDAARAVIDRNRRRTPKRLWTEAPAGDRLVVFEAYNEAEEAAYIVREIRRLVEAGGRYGDAAVMYRTNAQSRSVEDALVRSRIPYTIVGATRFYQRREVKDILAYLHLVHNPRDDFALDRVSTVPPRGIGPKAYGTLTA
ncbi:MAG: ATP-dependent helicase, partial [Anaerolineae bacterium]